MTSPALPTDHTARLNQARLALNGLSVGDALGETCFLPENWNALIEDPRATARGPWPYTDDTTMALAIFEILDEFGRIDREALAQRLAARYRRTPRRARPARSLNPRRRAPSLWRAGPPGVSSIGGCKPFLLTCPSRRLYVSSATAAASLVRTRSRFVCGSPHATWTTTRPRSS